MTTDVLAALANYIRILAAAREQTHRAEDWPRYTAHLAAAAQMFVAAHQVSGARTLQKLMADERRAYGWSSLADEVGAQAERAFNEFAAFVDRHRQEPGPLDGQ